MLQSAPWLIITLFVDRKDESLFPYFILLIFYLKNYVFCHAEQRFFSHLWQCWALVQNRHNGTWQGEGSSRERSINLIEMVGKYICNGNGDCTVILLLWICTYISYMYIGMSHCMCVCTVFHRNFKMVALVVQPCWVVVYDDSNGSLVGWQPQGEVQVLA